MDSEVRFLEITNERVGARVGLTGTDKVMLVQNKNLFGKLKGAEDFQLMNLQLERLYCTGIEQINLEKKYSKYLADFSKKEFEE